MCSLLFCFDALALIPFDREEVEEAIRREMEETEQFALDERVLEWSPSEVCFWLKRIQFGPYIEVFYSAQIFGDVLLQDIGTRMLTKFKVSSMHLPKLLREIDTLRLAVREKGVQIRLSEEIVREMNPQQHEDPRSKKSKKGGGGGGGKRANNKEFVEMERLYNEEKDRYAQLERESNEQEEQWREEYDEEKQLRIGYELELEQLKREYETLRSTGSKMEVEKLQNLISSVEESKIRTVRDLNEQLNSLRIACRLMQRENMYWKAKAGFHPIDSLVSTLGYSSRPTY